MNRLAQIRVGVFGVDGDYGERILKYFLTKCDFFKTKWAAEEGGYCKFAVKSDDWIWNLTRIRQWRIRLRGLS